MNRRASLLSFATLLAVILSGCASNADGNASVSPEDSAFYETYLENAAEYLKIDNPPEVEIVKWIKPEELQSYSDPCVRDQGFTQRSDLSWDVPEDQISAFNLATYKCWAAYPPLPKYAGPWTDKQRGIQYDWTVDHVIPCLQDHGYTIVGVPSRQTFIDTYLTDPFFPFSQVPLNLTNDQRNQLEQECPQIAPSELLFPGE